MVEEKGGCVMRTAGQKANAILLGIFSVSMAAYAVIFGSAFAELPLNIPPWHQLLLLCFHFIPMFFLQLLLCRRARLRWRLLIPPVLLAVPGFFFLMAAEWDVRGWILFLFWCAAPVLGCVLAWAVWAAGRIVTGRRRSAP